MKTKADAIREIVEIAERYELTPSDITKAMRQKHGVAHRRSLATALFAHLGGIFVFSGIAAYAAMFWAEMNSPARIIITLGVGVCCYLLGCMAQQYGVLQRLTNPLFVLAASLQPTGLLVMAHEFGFDYDWQVVCLGVSAIMFVQQAATYWFTRSALLLFTSIGFGTVFWFDAFDLLGFDWEVSFAIVGATLTAIAYNFRDGRHQSSSIFWFLLGGAFFMIGSFELLQGSPAELLYPALACGVISLSAVIQSKTLLSVGTISLLSYIGYFTNEHFVHSVGWPVSLIIIGVAFFLVSAGVLRLNRRYMTERVST